MARNNEQPADLTRIMRAVFVCGLAITNNEGETMKNSVLFELILQWELDAKEPEVTDESTAAIVSNSLARGERQAKRECADTLRTLIQILGDR